MGLFAGLFGGALSTGLGMLGQYMNVGYQKELQSHAAKLNYDYSTKYAKNTALNSPSWNRQGLMNAGYNPMLAVQNATSGSNAAAFTSAGQASPTDFGSDFAKGFANAQDIKRLDNESKQVEANVDAAYANADKAKAEKATLLERMPWISKREKAEIGNIEKDSLKKEAEIHNIDETTRYIEKNYELQKRLGEMGIDVARINAGANVTNARANVSNARSAYITAKAAERNAATSAKWTPVGIGAGLGAGILGFGLGKLKGLKYLKKAKVGF